MTERAWRLDSVGTQPGANETCEAGATGAPGNVSPNPGPVPVGGGYKDGRPVERWNDVVRRWACTRLERLGVQMSRFEAVLHEFTAIIETADNPVALKTALLRQVERMVPGYRVELTTLPAGGEVAEKVARGDRGGAPGPCVPTGCDESGDRQSVLEVPLRFGSNLRGRLRIRPRARGVSALGPETIRRLNTLCTLGACALERLDHYEGWPSHAVAEPPRETAAGSPGADQAGAPFANSPPLHDATFLNAVLPFALNQARRHNETLSLVCVAIDRIGGIQELMGRAVVDRLVQSVGETVAASIRASDIVARLDDDRIVAMLPRAPGGGALHVAQKICELVAEKSHDGYEMARVTVSIGVATFPACADNVFSLFEAADLALDRAENEGRNRACLAPRCAVVSSFLSAAAAP